LEEVTTMTDTILEETTTMLGLKRVKTQLDLLPLIRGGLPFTSLERVSRYLDMSTLVMVESLGLAKRTVSRRAQEKKLSPSESERLVRLSRVLAEAKHVLGSEEKARRWALKPSRALAGAIPLSLLDTDIGTNAVFEELGRIEHGVFA
jgi:putative toxin-antitoxin system antitoxin component (TIGR02293 family)